jgi:hypothetical protein
VTHIGNRDFAWFQSTMSKSRINFLQLLCAGDTGYRINEPALLYMRQQGLPQACARGLEDSHRHFFSDTLAWEDHLKHLQIRLDWQHRIATEGALLGVLAERGLAERLSGSPSSAMMPGSSTCCFTGCVGSTRSD